MLKGKGLSVLDRAFMRGLDDSPEGQAIDLPHGSLVS
jgi:hypothetical protein